MQSGPWRATETPFVVSLSNHIRPASKIRQWFDKLTTNGFFAMRGNAFSGEPQRITD